VIKIVTDSTGAAKDLDDTASQASKFGSGLKKAAAPAAAALLAVGAAAVSAAKAAAEDESAQAVLAKTMENTTGASASQVAQMEDFISKMTLATGVADDELRPAMGNLLRATGDAAESQKALSIALDVSAATGKSVESVTQAMSKGYGGSAASLKKLVPSLDDATVKSGDMNKIMAELAETTGGSMAAQTETAAGQMKIFQNAMGEAQEEAGSALLPILSKLADVLVIVAKWIGENTTLFLVIAGVIATVAGAILILNLAVTVYTAVTTLAGSATLLAWGAALLPILLVVAAVAAVIAIVVILWKKSETFRNVVTGVWNAVKKSVEFVTDAVGDLISKIGQISIPGFIRDAFDTIKAAVAGAWNKVGDLIDKILAISVPGFIKTAFENIRDAIEAAWNWIGNLIGRIGNINVPGAIRQAFEDIKTAVENAWSKVGDLAGKIAGISVPGAIKSAIDNITTSIGWLIGKVEDLIGALSRIHVPKIDLPGPLGLPGGEESTTVASFAAPRVRIPSRTSSSGGGITINVTGAIDPEGTARQIRRILAGHNRRIGLVT